MKERSTVAPIVIWAVLCLLSMVSVVQLETGWSRRVATLLVVVFAATKAHLVIRHFMEASRARPVWRLLYGAWTFAAAATIAIGYLLV